MANGTVYVGSPSYTSNVIVYPSGPAPVVGTVAYDSSIQGFKVYDGYDWQILSGNSQFGSLNAADQKTLEWAERKMREETELDELCKQHPGLAAAREQFEIMKSLVREYGD